MKGIIRSNEASETLSETSIIDCTKGWERMSV